jgi:DNA-binding response OmpR family regulator
MTSSTNPRVLIVEDDDAMAIALQDGFGYEGYDVTLARDGVEGFRSAAHGNPDLIILDVMLPRMSGLDVCKKLRGEGNGVPIIMLTARGQEIDKVLGLKLGADDYVTKPFSFLELVARTEAVLRRTQGNGGGALEVFRFGDVTLHCKRHEVHKGGEAVALSPREFRLLTYLIEHRGQVVTRERLLSAVWDYPGTPFTRTVDTHMAKLRKKLEDTPADPRYLVTVHRMGYKFVE